MFKKNLHTFSIKDNYSLFIISVFLIIGVIIAIPFLADSVLPLLILFLFPLIILFWYYPLFTFTAFFVFILAQELLVAVLSKYVSEQFGILIQVDEPIIFLFFIITMIRNYRIGKKIFFTGIEYILILFCIIGMISTFREHISPAIGMIQLFLTIKGLLLFYVIASYDYSIDDLKFIYSFLLYSGLIVLFLGLVELINPSIFKLRIWGLKHFSERYGGYVGLQSLFYHPGDYGWFTALVSLFAMGFYFFNRKKMNLFYFFLFFIGSVFSLRRKPLIGVLLAVIVGYIYFVNTIYKKNNFKRYIKFIVVISFILIVITPFLETVVTYTMGEYFGDEGVFQPRNILMLGSLKIALDYFPFGVGFGRYGSWMSWVHYSPVYYKYGLSTIWGLSPQHPNFIADTYWPMILGETGFMGFSVFTIIFIKIFISLRQAMKSISNKLIMIFICTIIMIYIESLVESIATAFFTKPPEAYVIFALIGIAYSIKNKQYQELL